MGRGNAEGEGGGEAGMSPSPHDVRSALEGGTQGEHSDVLLGIRRVDSSKRVHKGLAVSWAVGEGKLCLSKPRGGAVEGSAVSSPEGVGGGLQVHGSPKWPLSPRLLACQSSVSSTPSDTPLSSSTLSALSLSLGSSPSLAQESSSVSPAKVTSPTLKRFFSQQFSRRPGPSIPSAIAAPSPLFARSSLAAEGNTVSSPEGAGAGFQVHGSPKGELSPRLLAFQSSVPSTPSDTPLSSSTLSALSLSLGSAPPLAQRPSSVPDTLAAPVSPVKVRKPTVKRFFSQQFSRRPGPAGPSAIAAPSRLFARFSLAEQHPGDAKPDRTVGEEVVLGSKSLAERLQELDEEDEDEEDEVGDGLMKAQPRGLMEGLSRPSVTRIATTEAARGAGRAALPPMRTEKGKSSVWSSAATLLQRSKRAGKQQTAEEAGRAAASAAAAAAAGGSS